ncbi:MAG: RNA pseudouridine synthase [Treponema sp. GWB1_62_6]|nr:MAG: RNA pseudouridine synthase [Treponema sp. GWA1_62_8]OHE66427.1 MAG: RNA pseudouridine synthase [Treponema sp. GWB1_62_6]OHE67715.1 MAG: RNA pseudouridine synthase [Treponema sp. GWC1_61_84]OHE71852.1 MAG: RNA pseudouridine synthase [Treponema sp. RIFOXYC1_FULL_61_9]HCM29032.1 RNA pseudouridine synthase [Treponema sp.]
MKNLPVVYEDEEILVVDKPAGLAVQGGERVSVALIDILERQLSFRPFLVHRLDKDTSGLLIVAKTREAAAEFSRLLVGKAVRKTYHAVCAGCPAPMLGTIRDPVSVRGASKEAETSYRVLASAEGFSLLELDLGTGRMHQIRIHLAGIGSPVLGDDKYGDFSLNKRFRKDLGLRRLLLHARRLSIPSRAGGTLDLVAPYPEHFRPYLAGFDEPPACL